MSVTLINVSEVKTEESLVCHIKCKYKSPAASSKSGSVALAVSVIAIISTGAFMIKKYVL